MSSFADLIPVGGGLSLRTARVISVSSHVLHVDLDGDVQVQAVDGCNPRPNDTVLLTVNQMGMRAVAVIGGPYKQAALIATASTATTVTGLLNGVSTAVPKAGAFTVSNGQVCPLLWSADGSRVWAVVNEQSATSAPDGAGGSGGSPGGVTSGKSTYAPKSTMMYVSGAGWVKSTQATISVHSPAFFYGASRFRELQGRSITGIRAYLPGSGAPTVWGHPHASFPAGTATLAYNAGARSLGGWVSLPIGLATYLISGTGTGGLAFTGSGSIFGLPNGQIEISWRR